MENVDKKGKPTNRNELNKDEQMAIIDEDLFDSRSPFRANRKNADNEILLMKNDSSSQNKLYTSFNQFQMK